MPVSEAHGGTKTKLLDVVLALVRTKGYTATTVDEICQEAGVTKGAFFHHFRSKEDLAIAAAQRWGMVTSEFFAAAPYNALPDPLDRVLAYVDFRKAILRGRLPEFTCFAGTAVQEIYETHPTIREAAAKTILDHAAVLEAAIAAAMSQYGTKGDWSARSLALHTQAVLQGAFIMAKATGSAAIAAESVDHLRRYIEMLFRREQ